MPHLTGLKKNFTTYQLQQATALRSVYSWRLLELLSRFEDTGWLEISIEDFSQSMDAPEKQKADFAAIRRKIIEPSVNELVEKDGIAAIRRKIIEPSVNELVEKDGWKIQWKPIKTGRRVTALRFFFSKDDQLRLEI
ncbi:hypothetical protein AO282_16340 [Pseudomonas amygdali pv. morsprunorum]|nr:replication initiation protein [Pseudomonas amygdali]PHX35393.1 hypothetical protein AO282_16340 [Pseudomonas amygdali pv. morsprunorum]